MGWDHKRVNIRFFSLAQQALFFLMIVLLGLPVAVGLGARTSERFQGGLALLGIALVTSAALFYSFRKGDLAWLRSFDRGHLDDETRE